MSERVAWTSELSAKIQVCADWKAFLSTYVLVL
jgi:hypothetical protein